MHDPIREAQLLRTFVVPAKRDRYAGFVQTAGARRKLLKELHHFGDFHPRFTTGPSGPLDSGVALIAELRRRGAGESCYLVSVDGALDGRTVALDDAIDTVFACAEGTIVCCVPGKLAYYEGEGLKNRYILDREGP